ncbi:PREDICTED: zinc finger MYM-type protein 1-like [Diuraphis noxia]|uniref:zinc finger MYM-type protein 1-like n=1 Tax=Diuraphis noxia TaxID=143948 RepID=UPI0007638DCD|nr:PREDICTED: zinc finger MYM-type protein 1-like [Diuraphis noxia]
MNPFVKNGFSNWKKGDERISGHENSSVHQVCTMKWLHRLNNKTNINKQLTKQLEVEENDWIDILKRVVEAIRFLSTRGLTFRGSHEVIGVTDNGNYLGILELIAKFDPVLKAHIKNYGNKGRGSVSYISKTICEELIIGIMSLKVFDHIVDEIIKSKYFGIVVDSTPDLAHIDQLSIIIRYCLNGTVHERFLGFVTFHSHTGEALATTVLEFLKRSGIDIANCRAQTYDNAANMSGKYRGLQAQIKDLNDLAFYVPCVAHSLNLVGDYSAKECLEAINFFSILQKLYAFFAASTHRWDVLLRNSKKSSKTLKSLSSTRWSCRNDAIEALAGNYDEIFNTLSDISKDMNENADTRHDANSIKKKLIKLEIAFMTIFWKRVLGRFNATSVYLQRIEIDMVSEEKKEIVLGEKASIKAIDLNRMSDDDHSIGSSILDYYEYGQMSSCGSESNNSIIYGSNKDPEYNIYENQCIEYDVDDNFDVYCQSYFDTDSSKECSKEREEVGTGIENSTEIVINDQWRIVPPGGREVSRWAGAGHS